MNLCFEKAYGKESGVEVPKTDFMKVLFSKYRSALKPEEMAKEVGGNSSANVFQMFNKDHMSSFKPDISANFTKHNIPSAGVSSEAKTRLHKCLSQPDLVASGALKLPASMHLPAAFMRPTTPNDQFHTSTESSSPRPSEGRYHTDPSYNSSGILKSFKHELNLFGNTSQVNEKSVSAPSSPRRASSPNLEHDLLLMRQGDEARRLCKVQEETLPRKDSIVALPEAASVDLASKPQAEEPKLPAPVVTTDSVDGVMASSKQVPFTRSLIDWFKTPQPKLAEVNRKEFNAISPSSF